MPLSRLNDGFEIELEGIGFGMVDRQGHRWRCLITDRVLSAAIGGAPTRKQKTEWFRANRSLSNELPPTNSIWAHLKKMGSSALPIGDAAVNTRSLRGASRARVDQRCVIFRASSTLAIAAIRRPRFVDLRREHAAGTDEAVVQRRLRLGP